MEKGHLSGTGCSFLFEHTCTSECDIRNTKKNNIPVLQIKNSATMMIVIVIMFIYLLCSDDKADFIIYLSNQSILWNSMSHSP